MNDAFKTWDAAGETLESVEARIHDGIPVDRLHDRARSYARRVLKTAPWLSVKSSDAIVEVGPGVGYIMQAVAELCQHAGQFVKLLLQPIDSLCYCHPTLRCRYCVSFFHAPRLSLASRPGLAATSRLVLSSCRTIGR